MVQTPVNRHSDMNSDAPGIRAILFDLDGTLIDTHGLILASFRHTFRTAMGIEFGETELLEEFGRPLRHTFRRYAPERVEELVGVYRAFNLAHHDEMTRVFPGVVETLPVLKKKGYRLGIVTSKRRDVAMKGIRLFGMEPLFDVIIGEEDTATHKPDPAPLHEACRRLGIPPDEIVYVGDSPSDLVCAHNAGARSAAVHWSHFPLDGLLAHRPDFALKTMRDLEAVLENHPADMHDAEGDR